MTGENITTTKGIQNEVAPPAVGIMSSMMPVFLIMILFYFLIMRPQQKERKKRIEMLNSLKKGDRVSASGLVGTIHKIVNENEVVVELAENVRVHILKTYISKYVTKQVLEQNKVDLAAKDQKKNPHAKTQAKVENMEK